MNNTKLNDTITSGILLALCGTFLFSVKPILIKFAYELGLSSEQVISLRMIFALPVYLGIAVFIWLRQVGKRAAIVKNFPMVCALGVLGYFVASYLDLLGLQYISAQLERVVLFCFPTLVVIMSRIFFKTPVPPKTWFLLALSYAGILMIFGHDLSISGSEVALGTGLVFLSAICFAVFMLWSKPLIALVGSQIFTSISMLAASVAILVFFFVKHDITELQVSFDAYVMVFLLSIFCTVIPSLLVSAAIARIGPETTSIVGTFGPAVTSLLAVVLLGELFTVFHFVGLCLVMIALGLMMKKSSSAKGA